MMNIFEQPWLLLIVAGVAFMGVFIFRDVLPKSSVGKILRKDLKADWQEPS